MDIKKIQKLRLNLDKIDNEIIKLLQKRFNLSKKIAKVKSKEKIKIKDKSREEFIKNKYLKKLPKKFVTKFLKNLFKESRNIQKNY